MLARRLLGVAGAVALTLGARELPAQQKNPPFSFGMTLNSMAIDPTKAGSSQIHNQSWGMQLDAGYLMKRVLYLGVDLGPQMLSDHAKFTQNTTGGEMTSTASLVYFSAMAGPRTHPLQLVPGLPALALGVYGGASTTVAKRSIDKCVDCRVDDLTIPGGAFVQPTLLLGGGKVRMRLSHRQFLKGEGIRYVASAGMEFGGR